MLLLLASAAAAASLDVEISNRLHACKADFAACEPGFEVACAAGDLAGCGALASLLRGRWTDAAAQARADALTEQLCREAGALCLRAADTVDGPAAKRELWAIGCDNRSVTSCDALATSWLPPAPDADRARALAVYDQSCANEVSGHCLRAARLLLHGPPADVRRGMARLEALAPKGDLEVIASLVAVRFGGPENLPAELQPLWASCHDYWKECQALGAALVSR